MKAFPNWVDAPVSLLRLDGICGLLSVWAILKYFGKRTSAERLLKTTRYTNKNGVFAVGAAVALAAHGLKVLFFGDKDPGPHRIEAQLLKIARQFGVEKNARISLPNLLGRINGNALGLVLYDKPSGDAHFSPLLGLQMDRLILLYETEKAYSIREFNQAWKQDGILGQALIVSR